MVRIFVGSFTRISYKDLIACIFIWQHLDVARKKLFSMALDMFEGTLKMLWSKDVIWLGLVVWGEIDGALRRFY